MAHKPKKQPQQVIGINLSVEKRTLNRLHRMIHMILKAKVDNPTKQEALRIIPEVASIKNASLTNNSVVMGEKK